MNFIWSMINCMQILMIYPLYETKFPANTLMLYSFIITTSSFNFIPMKSIAIEVMGLQNEEPYSFQFE